MTDDVTDDADEDGNFDDADAFDGNFDDDVLDAVPGKTVDDFGLRLGRPTSSSTSSTAFHEADEAAVVA